MKYIIPNKRGTVIMTYTVPNQRIVLVHREHASSDFLGIKNENWKAAARDLGAHALLLYLYFASNKDNFKLALSPAAIRQSIGMPAQTYRDQFLKLVDKGYLVQTGGNVYEFYEVPHATRIPHENMENNNTSTVPTQTPYVLETPPAAQNETVKSREINKNNNKNSKNKGAEKQVSPTPSIETFRF